MSGTLHCFKCGALASPDDHFCKVCGDQIKGFKPTELKALKDKLIVPEPIKETKITPKKFWGWYVGVVATISVSVLLWTINNPNTKTIVQKITEPGRIEVQEKVIEKPIVSPSVEVAPPIAPTTEAQPVTIGPQYQSPIQETPIEQPKPKQELPVETKTEPVVVVKDGSQVTCKFTVVWYKEADIIRTQPEVIARETPDLAGWGERIGLAMHGKKVGDTFSVMFLRDDPEIVPIQRDATRMLWTFTVLKIE